MTSELRVPWAWGTTSDEFAADSASDAFAVLGAVRAVRAVDADADPSDVFLWLCQLRRAPYSYDLIDNLGRRSPRRADPAMTDLELGQVFMIGFHLIDFVPGHSITVAPRPGVAARAMGPLVMSYEIRHDDNGHTRLVGVLQMPPARSRIGAARLWLLAWGDLVMMRKQLHTLAALAARR